MYICPTCSRLFKNARCLSLHSVPCSKKFNKLLDEVNAFQSKQSQVIIPEEDNQCDLDFNVEDDSNDYDVDISLLEQEAKHIESGFHSLVENEMEYNASVLLLLLLKKAKCPLYLFDDIVQWAVTSLKKFRIDFNHCAMTRKKAISDISRKHNLME